MRFGKRFHNPVEIPQQGDVDSALGTEATTRCESGPPCYQIFALPAKAATELSATNRLKILDRTSPPS